uniref:Uncharacterized protein n=1 Tax=Trypanosoma congolense (strain IL3000) TaxID=1068625 RepID=G0UZX4_TRYCI|nr:conserved hypothetical protein [Trypanosoma congolense IL3000]
MDTLTYTCRALNANAMRFEVPLISVKAAAFSSDVPALISSHRRTLCMNMKQPNRLRILTRLGRYAEAEVGTPVLRCLISSEGLHDQCFFLAAGGDVVVQLRPSNQASGEVHIAKTEVQLHEEVVGVAVGYGDVVYALGKSHIFEVDMVTSKTKKYELTQRTDVRYPVIVYSRKEELLLVPAKTKCLDLISTKNGKSILPRAWEPHANGVPTSAFFFQRRTFSGESENSLPILTAARGNTELRLWCYNKDTRTFSLRQDVCISSENDEGEVGEDSFHINCTPSEEYITLCSPLRPLAVVLELSRSSFKIDRITTWKLKGPALASSATVSKATDTLGSKSVEYQLILTIRTATGFYDEVLDVEKLAGASNTAALKMNSVAAWFPQEGTSDADVASLGLPAALTAVSSSVLGDKTTNAVPQGLASKIVRQQALQFCETLRSIDEGVVNLQKRASDAMRLFQDARERERAQTIGRQFAIRNKGRLNNQQLGGQSADTLNQKQRRLLEEIRSAVENSERVAADTAKEAVRSSLSRRLKDAVQKGVKEAEQIDINSGTPVLRSTDSMRVFSNGLDASVRELVRALKEHCKVMKTSVGSSSTTTANCIARAKEFTQSIKREKQLLATELEATKDAVSRVGTQGSPLDLETLVARATSVAEKGDWVTAFTSVLEASNIAALLCFLESKVCVDNVATMVSPQTIPLPTFLSLCLQLSYELGEQLNLIPLRIQSLHTFFVEWDDTLKDMKQNASQGDSRCKTMYELTRRELGSVVEQLTAVDDKSVDRRSRNNLRLVRKLINSLLAPQ